MFKKPLTYWIIAILLFIAFAVVWYNITKTTENDPDEVLVTGIVILASAIIALICGSTLGALAAFIPFKKQKYIKKFWLTFPLATILIIGVFLYFYGNEGYMIRKYGDDKSIGPSKTYSEVEIPKSLDCSSVHDGSFETNSLIIERHGEKQTQTVKNSKMTIEYKVTWISDCEYQLTSKEDSTHIMKVKIINVDSAGYYCYAAMGGKARKYRISKIRSTSN